MDAQELYNLRTQLSALILMARTMQETYKAEIEHDKDVEVDIDVGIRSLEDALRAIDKIQIEPHANSSAANYRDYMAEERATTERE